MNNRNLGCNQTTTNSNNDNTNNRSEKDQPFTMYDVVCKSKFILYAKTVERVAAFLSDEGNEDLWEHKVYRAAILNVHVSHPFHRHPFHSQFFEF